jgi:hypothetical protein
VSVHGKKLFGIKKKKSAYNETRKIFFWHWRQIQSPGKSTIERFDKSKKRRNRNYTGLEQIEPRT